MHIITIIPFTCDSRYQAVIHAGREGEQCFDGELGACVGYLHAISETCRVDRDKFYRELRHYALIHGKKFPPGKLHVVVKHPSPLVRQRHYGLFKNVGFRQVMGLVSNTEIARMRKAINQCLPY